MFGLWLNLDRSETRKAAGVLTAIKSALGGDVAPEWFKAIADNEEHGQAMFEEAQAIQSMRD